MSSQKNPDISKTVLIWGAGADAALGYPTTIKQNKALSKLFLSEKDNFRDRIMDFLDEIQFSQHNNNQEIVENLEILFELLNPRESEDFEVAYKEAIKKKLIPIGITNDEEIDFYRYNFDWDALECVFYACPGSFNSNVSLQDVFTFLDLHINTGKGFLFKEIQDSKDSKRFIHADRFPSARRTLAYLIYLMFYLKSQELTADKLKPYNEFVEIISKRMYKEGLSYSNAGIQSNTEVFCQSSLSVISMNWCPLLLALWFKINKDFNNSDIAPYGYTPPQKIKNFHDFTVPLAVVQDKNEVWYSPSIPAAKRINDPEHRSGRLYRLTKYLIPHGALTWRECKNCGHLVMTLPVDWSNLSSELLPVPIFNPCKPNNNDSDVKECSYCQQGTRITDIPLIMQSTFKGEHSIYLEAIQRAMKVALEDADHLILAGYSIPEDDFIYRAHFSASRNHNTKCTLINYNEEVKNKHEWLYGTNYEEHLTKEQFKDNNDVQDLFKTIERTCSVFGKGNVRVYTGGIPAVFGDPITEKSVSDLINWSEVD